MRILWLPKNLEIGGAQVDALTIGRSLASAGHELIVAAPDGPLRERLGDMEYTPIPDRRSRLGRFSKLVQLMDRTRPELVHAIGEHQILEAHFASRNRFPVSGSLMSARLPWTIPEDVRITVCMPHLEAFSRLWRVHPPHLVLPPIEMPHGSARADHLWQTEGPRVLVVSRLAQVFKEEGIDRTMRAVAAHPTAELVVVGDGPHRAHYETLAEELAPDRIHLPGAMIDPNPAFAAADVVLGSGGSVLRGMAHAKATITLGRNGFASTMGPDTVDTLMHQGFFGVGAGLPSPDPLIGMLDELLSDDGARQKSVLEGHNLVSERYDIMAQRPALLDFIAEAATAPPPGWGSSARTVGRMLHYRVRKEAAKRQGLASGLKAEALQHFIGKQVREAALGPRSFGTGRNLRPPTPA